MFTNFDFSGLIFRYVSPMLENWDGLIYLILGSSAVHKNNLLLKFANEMVIILLKFQVICKGAHNRRSCSSCSHPSDYECPSRIYDCFCFGRRHKNNNNNNKNNKPEQQQKRHNEGNDDQEEDEEDLEYCHQFELMIWKYKNKYVSQLLERFKWVVLFDLSNNSGQKNNESLHISY